MDELSVQIDYFGYVFRDKRTIDHFGYVFRDKRAIVYVVELLSTISSWWEAPVIIIDQSIVHMT